MADYGTYNSWDEFIKKHKTGKAGDTATVSGKQYRWNESSKIWVSVTNPTASATSGFGPTSQGPSNSYVPTSSGYTPITQGGAVGYTGNGFVAQDKRAKRTTNLDVYVYTGQMVPETKQLSGSNEPDVPSGMSGVTKPTSTTLVPEKINASDYFQSWFDKSPAEVKKLQKKLQMLNALGNNFTPGLFDEATQLALTSKLQLMSQFQNPEHNLNSWFGTGSIPGVDLIGGTGGPTTTTSIQNHLYNAQTLKSTVNTVYKQALGREATKEELDAAVKAVNAAQKKTPSKTVSTSSGAGSGSVSVKSTSSGGVDAAQMIEDQAKTSSEYAPYQMATTYFDAMLNTLNGPVGRGA